MSPRGTPDIGWADLVFGLLRSVWPDDPAATQARIEGRWSGSRDTLACLSVRSGLDLLLQAAAWPRGSEVLVSAVTIPDMITLLEQHGLVPVPIDLDPETLAVDLDQLRQAITSRTRAILVAHLFGSRMLLAPLVAIAREHGLFVIEDCAQAYDAVYRGDPGSDARLWSFGPIKTETALGGAIVQLKDAGLLAQMRRIQSGYPRQRRMSFARRVLLMTALKFLARPERFVLFVALCRLLKRDHDRLLYTAVRGFAGRDLLARLRHQPSAPLLRLLERRLLHADADRVARRAAFARRMLDRLPEHVQLGARACRHTHWVIPILSAAPDTLVRVLQAQGFDATRVASSLICVPPAPARPRFDPVRTRRWLERIVYLPTYQQVPEHRLAQLARIVREVEAARLEAGSAAEAVQALGDHSELIA
ncbi:MAG TPA: aminotransferase class I/II-fold pyridoxal phosphate-dependent enzyme [Herpetosiphonaceae bacterium]